MFSPAFVKLPETSLGAPKEAPPGLEPMYLAPPGFAHLKVDQSISPPPGLAQLKGERSGSCDDTSVGSGNSTDGSQSDTASSVCEGEFAAVPSLASSEKASSTATETELNGESKLKVDAPAFVPSELRTRTALQSSARQFKPQLPFVPMAQVSNAWQQWHMSQASMGMEPAFGMPGQRNQANHSRKRMPKK